MVECQWDLTVSPRDLHPFDSIRHVTGRHCRLTGLPRRAAATVVAYLPTGAGGTMGTPYALMAALRAFWCKNLRLVCGRAVDASLR